MCNSFLNTHVEPGKSPLKTLLALKKHLFSLWNHDSSIADYLPYSHTKPNDDSAYLQWMIQNLAHLLYVFGAIYFKI